MAFIDINDIRTISNLNRGEFALPALGERPNQLLADTPRLRSSIRAIITVMQNRNLEAIAALIPETHRGQLPQHLNNLELSIIGEMTTYLADQEPEMLVSIFHKVQLWGGRTGRGIYVRNGGFSMNWNEGAYQDFVAASSFRVLNAGPDPRIPNLQPAAVRINQFGVAFATKHARFWAQAANVRALPIYDRIMAQGSLGINPRWNEYSHYVTEMTDHALQAGTDVATLERHAFNAFGSPAGQAWINARM